MRLRRPDPRHQQAGLRHQRCVCVCAFVCLCSLAVIVAAVLWFLVCEFVSWLVSASLIAAILLLLVFVVGAFGRNALALGLHPA